MSRGTIRQRGSSFEVRLSDGRHPDGRRRMVTRTAHSLEGAEALLRSLGGDPPGGWPVGPPPRRRWPLQPLLDTTLQPSVQAVERAAGLPSGIGRRWATHGLTDETADRVAIQLGLHPACIWSDW